MFFRTVFTMISINFLNRLRRPDPLDPEGPRIPRKPATINQYRRQILRFASDLIHAGIPPSQIDSVLVLIDPAMAELGLRHMLARHNDETRRGIAEAAGLLRNISRILNAPEEVQDRIADLVGVRKQVGMTRKNRERLRVLQNEDKLQKLSGPDLWPSERRTESASPGRWMRLSGFRR